MANTTQNLPNVHPGEILEEEFLKPLGITRYRLAKDINVPATRIAEICARKRAVSADTAIRLAKYFGTTPKFWLGLQQDYDLEEELKAKESEFAGIQPSATRSSKRPE
ncbi:MAG: HigA family addiction module antidote protein [Planctomycetes bacterium]|nr:HigA family addiction module antidote protein [Planctomycetota bacterium]